MPEKMKKVRDDALLRYDPEELEEAFTFAPAHPLWQAIMIVAEVFREAAVIVATDPDLSQKETDMALGGVATMDDWIAELNERAGLSRAKQEAISTPAAVQEVEDQQS